MWQVELEELRRRVEELDQAVSDGLGREEALQSELNLERKETSRLRSRAQEERSVNSDLRGDNEALMAETEKLQGDKEAMQAELTHVRTTLRVMRATMGATSAAAEHDDASGEGQETSEDDAQSGSGSASDEAIPNGDTGKGSVGQDRCEENGNDSDGVGGPVDGGDAAVLSPHASPSADGGENRSLRSEDCDAVSSDGYSSVTEDDDEEGNDDGSCSRFNAAVTQSCGINDAPS